MKPLPFQALKDRPAKANCDGMSTRRLRRSFLANSNLMALMNTRDENGNIHLLTGRGNVFPEGAITINSFSELHPPDGSSAGNPELVKALSIITKQPQPGANFDEATLTMFDQNIDNFFESPDWVKIAQALKLNTEQ